MGQLHSPAPVLRMLAAFSRHDDALDWCIDQATAAWGPVALASPRFDFSEADYYQPTMGAGLRKCFWAFEQLADPASLAEWKLLGNRWEEQYAALARHSEPRPLNVDPGYLTPAKLVLASTKDHAHRLYLAQGIYAEVTLAYRDKDWQPCPWTFPDYRRDDYRAFFDQCRAYLRERLRAV